MSTRNTPTALLAFGRIDTSAPAAVVTSQDGGILSITSASQTDFTVTLVDAFDGAAVQVVATPETTTGLPQPQTCAVIVDGLAATVRVVADRGTAAVRLTVTQIPLAG